MEVKVGINLPDEDAVKIYERGLTVTDGMAITDEVLSATFPYLLQIEDKAIWFFLDLFQWCLDNGLEPMNYIGDFEISKKTLQNRLAVLYHYPHPEDRKWNVTFSHYAEVARKTVPPPKQAELLERAEKYQLSVAELREEVQEFLGVVVTDKNGFSVIRFFSATYDLYMWAKNNECPNEFLLPVLKEIKMYEEEYE